MYLEREVNNMSKPTTIRLSEYDQERIQNLKQFYSECWGITPEEITTTEIISWSIGLLHAWKCEETIQCFTNKEMEEM